MARQRSPNYPRISLREAISRVSQIHSIEGQNAASRDVMVHHMGFSGLTGASLPVLSALKKYGLLESAGNNELRVSQLALSILYPHDDESEKITALKQAANNPPLFAEINEKWPDHPPSDANLRAYLIRRKFAQKALDNVIQCYRDTMKLVSGSGEGYNDSASNGEQEAQKMETGRQEAGEQDKRLPSRPPREMRVSLTEGELEVSARLSDVKGINRLIRILETNKLLFEQVLDAMDTREDETEDANDEQ